jgi:hypothetical protein
MRKYWKTLTEKRELNTKYNTVPYFKVHAKFVF